MHKFRSARDLGHKIVVVLALPLVATAVFFADNLRALTFDPTPGKSLVASAVEAWQDDGLDETLGAHSVELNDENRLVGTVTAIQEGTGDTIPIAGLAVKLVRGSKQISSNTTDIDGNFKTNVIESGTYTLCISGREGFLAYGIQIIEPSAGASDESLPEPDGAAQTSSVGDAQLIVHRVSQDDKPQDIKAAVIPPTHKSLKEIMNGIPGDVGMDGSVSSGGTQINIEESVVAGGFQVNLQADGTLVGRIAPLTSKKGEPIRLQEMNVYLMQNDKILSQIVAEEDGSYTFNNVKPGVYGFAAAGRDGFAALSFQAVQAREELNSSNQNGDIFKNASETSTKDGSDSLNVAICPPEDIPFLRREINGLGDGGLAGGAPPLPPMDPMMANGGPGGGFGPGGGGFNTGGGGGGSSTGFGNFGGLIEAGLGAWVLSELFSNRNDNAQIINPPVVLPPVVLPPAVLPPPTSPFFASPVSTVGTGSTTGGTTDGGETDGGETDGGNTDDPFDPEL